MGEPRDEKDVGFDELMERSFAPKGRVSTGDTVDAKVLSVGKDYVFLDVGAREEGLLSREEAMVDGEVRLKQGDTLKVFVAAVRGGAALCTRHLSGSGIGAVTLAERPDGKAALYGQLKEAFDAGVPVEGVVKESVKGGFSINIIGMRAFCPISQIDNKYCEHPEEHIGRSYVFEIIKLEEGGRNIVVSRRKPLEREAEQVAQQRWQEIAVGQVCTGTISSLKPYGAFVDLGGVEGLLHVSEISYERVSNPADVLQVGQQVEVEIKELDPARRRIGLSLKAMMANPWDAAETKLHKEQVLTGKVVRLAPFGAFVQLLPGLEGLLHVSALGGEKRVYNPREVLKEGEDVMVRILEIDYEQHRVSLTLDIEKDYDSWKQDLAQSSAAPSPQRFGTFGDLLKGSLKK